MHVEGLTHRCARMLRHGDSMKTLHQFTGGYGLDHRVPFFFALWRFSSAFQRPNSLSCSLQKGVFIRIQNAIHLLVLSPRSNLCESERDIEQNCIIIDRQSTLRISKPFKTLSSSVCSRPNVVRLPLPALKKVDPRLIFRS